MTDPMDLTPPAPGKVRVSVVDEDGSGDTAIVGPDDYTIIAVGQCYVHHTQVHANGTHVLTIKGRRRG